MYLSNVDISVFTVLSECQVVLQPNINCKISVLIVLNVCKLYCMAVNHNICLFTVLHLLNIVIYEPLNFYFRYILIFLLLL